MMDLSLNEHQTRLVRLHAQRLTLTESVSGSSPEQVVQAVFGVQAQDLSAAQLAIGVRSTGLSIRDVERARQEQRTIVRTWGMRGTLHLLAAEDVRWLIPFLGPVFIAAGRRRFLELGWDEARSAEGLRLLRQALADQGPLTREEIIRILEKHNLPHEGQAPIHLIYRAALEGILCMGADRKEKSTYVFLEDWISQPLQSLPTDKALAELARRYLQAYAPCGPDDMARWSGLPLRATKQAFLKISQQSVQVAINGQPAWILKSQLSWLEEVMAQRENLRLLPRFDNYLLGYADRGLAVAPSHAQRIHPGGGIIHPALILDGRVIGVWKTRPRRLRLELIVEPFEELDKALLPKLEAEAARIASYLETKIEIQII
jgi:hypothetical protein